jgi:hypothetical protein
MTFSVISRKTLVVVGLAACAIANADDVELVGSASGTFNNGLTSISGLSYTGSTFDTTSSGGFYALGNNAGTPNFNNLGSFTLTGAPGSYVGDTFTLDVTFTSPAGIQGSSSADYTATLFGNVTANNQGGVEVAFTNSPQGFTFSNGKTSGSFDLYVNQTSITAGNVSPVTGYGMAQAQAVPEPAPMLCMLTGLLGVGIRSRRKK